MNSNQNHAFKNYFLDFDVKLGYQNVVRIIKFLTWSRLIYSTQKESLLGNIYTTDPADLINLYTEKPIFGDHLMIKFEYASDKCKQSSNIPMNWYIHKKE